LTVNRGAAFFVAPSPDEHVHSAISVSRLASDDLLDLDHELGLGLCRTRQRAGIAAFTWVARFERATPSVSAIVFTTCRPAPARARATAIFWLHQIQCLAQDLVFQGLFAKQPLRLRDLALQGTVFGGRHDRLARAHRRQRAFGVAKIKKSQRI